jgi:hypothetical protein
MNKPRISFAIILVFVATAAFFAGVHFNPGASVQAGQRPFQTYKVIKMDATSSQLILTDQMNQYAEAGYRYRDSRDGLVIMEYAGK